MEEVWLCMLSRVARPGLLQSHGGGRVGAATGIWVGLRISAHWGVNAVDRIGPVPV